MHRNPELLELGHQRILVLVREGDGVLETVAVPAADLGQQEPFHTTEPQATPDQEHARQVVRRSVDRPDHARASAHQNGHSSLNPTSVNPARSSNDVISSLV